MYELLPPGENQIAANNNNIPRCEKRQEREADNSPPSSQEW
jgi:hypothetical protein